MIRFCWRRFLPLPGTLLAIVVMSFFVIRLAPGSPFSGERALPPEVRKDLVTRYGLDQPMVHQLGAYLGQVARGHLGRSIAYPRFTVAELVADGLPVSLGLAIGALAWALVVGVALGTFAARCHETVWDDLGRAMSLLGVALPSFILAPLLILLFALTLYALPPAGWESWRHAILPVVTLGATRAAWIARLTRLGLLETARAPFVRAAVAKGLSPQRVLWNHQMRSALIPVLTYVGPAFSQMVVGSVVVETIFGVPGLGRTFVEAAFSRDYPVVMGVVIVYSLFLLTLNLVVDVAHATIDPRVRQQL